MAIEFDDVRRAARDALGIGSLWIGDDHIEIVIQATVQKLRDLGVHVPELVGEISPRIGVQSCMDL